MKQTLKKRDTLNNSSAFTLDHNPMMLSYPDPQKENQPDLSIGVI